MRNLIEPNKSKLMEMIIKAFLSSYEKNTSSTLIKHRLLLFSVQLLKSSLKLYLLSYLKF